MEITYQKKQARYSARSIYSDDTRRRTTQHHMRAMRPEAEKHRTGNRAVYWEEFYGRPPVEIQNVPRPT